jgi:tetratricopeptide (TPR) repeat protein
MKNMLIKLCSVLLLALALSCQSKKDSSQFKAELNAINLSRGEIALCGSGQFGQVDFGLSCEEKVRADFNLATSLLHSFEYAEAEKVFAKVIDGDPECIMAYWGAAMSNFHPLWAPPTNDELTKGSKTVALARKLDTNKGREAQYLEAIAAIFDNWEKLDHKTRLGKFVTATEAVYNQNPEDKEAAIFYALALRAAADPADKSFEKQKKAGAILSSLFPGEPNHPGIAHYLIHTYDYPELAEMALPAARKYASIASNSAHAQHMPSHIFTRLGLWDESIQSNLNSTEAAKCYAEKLGKEGHWDQELHGMDYLVYAYLQQAKDDKAKEQVDYLATVNNVFPVTFVDAYTFAAVPVRYALERKDWKQAATLELHPTDFPWDKFIWQKGIHHFGRLLGAVHMGDRKNADVELAELKRIQSALMTSGKDYEANQVQIQIKSGEAWMNYAFGKKADAIQSMITAADMEDATEKHPVTPGEVAPARELLGDMYMAMGEFKKAGEAYESNLKKRPNRFNSLYGAAVAAKKMGDQLKAKTYFEQLMQLSDTGNKSRPELKEAESFLKV